VTIEVLPDAMDAPVPNLILQPLVENAIRHGIEPHPRPGHLTIRASKHNEWLSVTILDTGNGIPEGGFKREGIGLSNTRERLRELYGLQHRFEISNRAEGGLQVSLEIPLSLP
jgi:sensor histidine kinase YesM